MATRTEDVTTRNGRVYPKRLQRISQKLPALQKALTNAERLRGSLDRNRKALGQGEETWVLQLDDVIVQIRTRTERYRDALAEIEEILARVEDDETVK